MLCMSSLPKGQIAAIFRLLLAVPFNKITVQNRLQSVTRMAATCQSAAEDMESAFVRWGEFIKELHASCESEEGHAMHLFGNAKSDIEAKEIIKTSREEMLKEQKAKVTEMETKVDENHKMFMKLLKDFPSG